MPLPNFMIIGAAKCGTTSLWSYLDQHPDVFFAPYKEPNYFALAGETLPDGGPAAPEVISYLIHPHSVTNFERYLSLFDFANGQKAVGEASVRYLYYAHAPERIRETVPGVRMIAVLRHPVSRLYSHYCMNVQFQLEPLSLLDALEAEDERREAGWGWDWHYTNVSSYAAQLTRYLATFEREQLKVFLHEDLVQKPMEVFREVCRHIGIDDGFVPDTSKREKVAYRPRNLAVDRWLHWPNPTRERIAKIRPRRFSRKLFDKVKAWNSAPVPVLDATTRERLTKRFADDIREVEDLLGRKTGWIS